MALNRPQRKRDQRGAAAVETALSLVILTFVASAGIYFTDAMVVRQRLTTATSRAARVCARAANVDNVDACVNAQVRAGLGPQLVERCAPLNVTSQEVPLPVANLTTMTASVTCGYTNPIARFLQFNDVDGDMTLRAQASMPIAR